MNAPDPNDSLSRTLAAWQLEPTPDPQFRPGVWQRIHAQARMTWGAYVHAHLARWSAVGALALIAAAWVGHHAAETRLEARRDAMIAAYLVELDPRVQAQLRPLEP